MLDEWQEGVEGQRRPGLDASMVELCICVLIMARGGSMTTIQWGVFVDDRKGGRYWIRRCLTGMKHRLRREEVQAVEIYDRFW